MQKNKDYIDIIMRNNAAYDTSEDMQKGGEYDVPFGGFPPIFLCSDNIENKLDADKKREFAPNKTAVSIKDILKSRTKN